MGEKTVNLTDFQIERRGTWGRSVAQVRDVAGEETHRLIIEGQDDLVREVLGESDFEVEIDPAATREQWEERLAERLRAQRETPSELDEVERLAGLFKELPGRPSPRDSVVVSLERLQTRGTSYLLVIPLFVPRGVDLFFLLPPICFCEAAVVPASGDPDLLLAINSPGPPFVATSLLPGTMIDRVSWFLGFCPENFGFVPFLRVRGFVASFCGLIWGGFAFP
jgi:hypothetical protein